MQNMCYSLQKTHNIPDIHSLSMHFTHTEQKNLC